MKRQRNIQQVKEQGKCPPNQTKEEEIRNLPNKEFQIMIVKIIQNLEIKMESQINSLETMRKLHNKENSTNCQNTERTPKTQQYKQDEETKEYQAGKGTG